MNTLAILYKLMNIYSHNAHNYVKGSLFNQDHSFLAELYETYDGVYDDTVERMIGLGEQPDLVVINVTAAEQLRGYPPQMKENKECFQKILDMEKKVCSHIEELIASGSLSQGTINMLADQADKSEARQYKISRRIM